MKRHPRLDLGSRIAYDENMGIIKRLGEWFPTSEHPAYYRMSDDAPSMSVDVFREAPLDTSDSEAAAKREEIRRVIFENFFGTPEERIQHGSKCFPFNELAPDAITTMPMALRASYEAELSCARDPRSGRIVRPYIPPGVVEKPNV